MTCLGTAVVIDFSIQVNAPAWDNMRMPVGADGTKPVMFGFGQLRGDPIPGQERDGFVHIAFRKFRAGNFCRFHAPEYKAIPVD